MRDDTTLVTPWRCGVEGCRETVGSLYHHDGDPPNLFEWQERLSKYGIRPTSPTRVDTARGCAWRKPHNVIRTEVDGRCPRHERVPVPIVAIATYLTRSKPGPAGPGYTPAD